MKWKTLLLMEEPVFLIKRLLSTRYGTEKGGYLYNTSFSYKQGPGIDIA